MHTSVLRGLRVVSIALNLPGPAAARRFVGLGAMVTKVEPPDGDPMARYHPVWHAALAQGQYIRRIDLKSEDGRAELEELLDDAHLLITSSRPSALARLELDWPRLSARHSRLSLVAITGYPAPDAERTGHDLTYLAAEGLVVPPGLPRSLVADLAGAERAVSAALAILLDRERTGNPGFAEVSLAQVARDLAEPLRMGITAPGGLLGGGHPGYGLYRARDGWVAVAALEPHFLTALQHEVGGTAEEMATAFLKESAAHWERRGAELDIPMVAVSHES